MSAEVGALQLLRVYCNSGDVENLSAVMNKIPLETMEESQTDKLLIYCLNNCCKGNSILAAKWILNRWNELTPDHPTILNIWTKLFTLTTIDDAVLQWLAPELETETYEFVIAELIQFDNSSTLLPTYQRATNIYGMPTTSGNDDPNQVQSVANKTYKYLYNIALDNENNIAAEYLKMLYVETNIFADAQSWVINEIQPLPTHSQLLQSLPELKIETFKLPNVEESVNLLTSGLRLNGISIEETDTIVAELHKKLQHGSTEERQQLLQPVLESQGVSTLQDDEKLFRIMGPANPYYDADLTIDHICYKYGGCRMQTCTCFEYIDTDNEISADDWFTGACQVCCLRIRGRAHALRLPLKFGGFKGCYCSNKCIRDNIIIPDILTNMMLDRISAQLQKYKIQDRVDVVSTLGSDYTNDIPSLGSTDVTY